MAREEIVLPFPIERELVPIASQFRSTWLSSSLKGIRERGLLEKYLVFLPSIHHEPILHSIVGVWLPIEVAHAHYEACDRLELSDDEIYAIGAEIAERVHGTVLHTAVRLAKGVGVTPWTILPQLQRLWDRIWVGGGVAAFKLGPKEARIEIVGWPCARFRYTRIAMRGVISSLVALFCTRIWVQEIPSQCTSLRLAYRLHWA